jgi:hypothetical protein
VKVFISILFITFLTGLPLVEDVYGSFKPKSKSKNSCTIFRGKYTVSDQIEYRYGIVAGQNIATIKSIKGDSQDVISRLMAGVALQVIWPKGFVVQPELLYSQKGCIYSGTDTKYNIDYLEIPVKVAYRLHLAEIKPFVFAAPYAAYAIKLTPNGDMSIADNDSDQFNKFDGGIGVGAGFDVWKVQLSFRYSWGFAQVLNEAYPIRNKVFTISAGLLF